MKTPMNVFNTAMKKKEQESQGLLSGRIDRLPGNHGNSGCCIGSDFDWLH